MSDQILKMTKLPKARSDEPASDTEYKNSYKKDLNDR